MPGAPEGAVEAGGRVHNRRNLQPGAAFPRARPARHSSRPRVPVPPHRQHVPCAPQARTPTRPRPRASHAPLPPTPPGLACSHAPAPRAPGLRKTAAARKSGRLCTGRRAREPARGRPAPAKAPGRRMPDAPEGAVAAGGRVHNRLVLQPGAAFPGARPSRRAPRPRVPVPPPSPPAPVPGRPSLRPRTPATPWPAPPPAHPTRLTHRLPLLHGRATPGRRKQP